MSGRTDDFQLGEILCLKEQYRRRLSLSKSCGTLITRHYGYIKVKLHARNNEESEWYDPTWWIRERLHLTTRLSDTAGRWLSWN